MPRPLIGITTYLEAARWGTWVREAAISPQGYAIAVLKSGGVPVLVPPFSPSAARDYMRGLDGLVLAGGVEVDPSLYGEAPDDRVDDPQPQRDRFEVELAKAAVEADKPILAISRGMHVLNVAQGGTLISWLPDVVAHDRHATKEHVITVSVSSKLGKALGDRAEVAGAHHQAVRRLGTGLIAVAWADDQIVEGVELQGHRFGVGIQWHPERGGDLRVFEALVESCA
ncbi:gamma-glutamyl-gamma-aminobutyrate hydrolase family protein [Streptosporangiaceae bacterium NEAU-GS5]|nr:gamma-glutamyl-gamma-aminobutyrate hydrolase family protein [Streptosporangiaceae bacterium NEAU-GS5]